MEHGPQIVHGQWSGWEAQQSSTWGELKAVHTVLQALAPKLQNERLRWFTDNQNVVRIVLHGSKKPLLQELRSSICISIVCCPSYDYRTRMDPQGWLTILASLGITTTGWSARSCFNRLIDSGDLTLLTSLQTPTMLSWNGLTRGSGIWH